MMLKLKLLGLLMAPALFLTACTQALQSIAAPPAAQSVVITGSKALLLAEDGYQLAATIATRMTEAGLIRGTTATRVREINRRITDALERGHAARDEANKARFAAQALLALDELRAITGETV